jgi:3-hydroxybutyryl-CoA dehydrogenase
MILKRRADFVKVIVGYKNCCASQQISHDDPSHKKPRGRSVMDLSVVIGLVGAGTMGAAIAQGAATAGFKVLLNDRDPKVLERAMAQVKGSLGRAVEKGRLSQTDADATLARLVPTPDPAGLAPCGLVIEAIIENAEAKESLFKSLSGILAPTALIATNTSSLKVDDLARAVSHPERFLGLHYFFPAAINPLLEIVKGSATSDAAMDGAARFGEMTQKKVIRCKDAFGFAVNRYFVPYLNEAVRLLDEGFDAGEIDLAITQGFSTSVGPFKLMDMSKPAIALHACRTLAQMGPFYEPAPKLVTKGQSGENWDAPLPAEVAPGRARTIVDRLQGAVLTAVIEAVEEGVAAPADFDLGAKVGLQWGWQPCTGAKAVGKDATKALVERYFAGRAIPAGFDRLFS